VRDIVPSVHLLRGAGKPAAKSFWPLIGFLANLQSPYLIVRNFRRRLSAGGHSVIARRILEGASYDPETVQILCTAYDRAKKELHDKGQPEIVKEIIARRILALAEQGERDPERLCAGALSSLPR
jgi:hypothetical protein